MRYRNGGRGTESVPCGSHRETDHSRVWKDRKDEADRSDGALQEVGFLSALSRNLVGA